MKLPSGWYVLCAPSELSARKPNGLRRFGRDWVVWRGPSGQWVIQSDACPHRSAKLSAGAVCEGRLRCRFHGWDFDEEGACVRVPEIGRDAPGIRIGTQKLREANGFLWFRHGRPGSDELPWFPELDGRYSFGQSVVDWPTHFSRCVENQLDYAHLPFVHANSIGRGFDPAKKRPTDADADKVRVLLNPERGESGGYFEFRYPNIWRLYLGPRMSQFLAFVPVDEGKTRIYLRGYQRWSRIPGIAQLINLMMKPANAFILRQDYSIVMTQEPRNALESTQERLFPSDKPIQEFRRWLAGQRDSASS